MAVVEIHTQPKENWAGVPEMCKWSAFTIDRKRGVCKDGPRTRENIFHYN